MKNKKEFRYQFLRWETVGTGKFRKESSILSGLIGPQYWNTKKSHIEQKVEIYKEVAIVFDKQTGKIKLVDKL